MVRDLGEPQTQPVLIEADPPLVAPSLRSNRVLPGQSQEPAQEPDATGFPVVGIGASAGGLGAFESFFDGLSDSVDTGMAFVLVQHLAPDHDSLLAELIRRVTPMPVFEVVDGMVVAPNCVYIIPPGCDMAFLQGSLRLSEPGEPYGQRRPIDYFFRSLAQAQHERAIGVVLSGTGSDGTQGLRAIKAEGGLAMVQTPDSAEFDGMPRSAIATGLVDSELPPLDMGKRLVAFAAQAVDASLMQGDAPGAERAIKKAIQILRNRTGHDFSQYKPSTIHRRIQRRQAVHQIPSLEAYASFLEKTPTEAESLFRDLLIGVTHFFRDPECFQALEEQVIPRLFTGKMTGASIRVWCPGCSTGEEAYSIAILLQERMDVLKLSFKIQIFATDIDARAIAIARAGLYPPNIAGDLSPERLARFFTHESEGGGYRIHKTIRDMLVFSEQDLVKDPPFSKLDLISCRNLLIYLSAELQKSILPLFHYALNAGGFLFQGMSETVGEFTDLFAPLDRKAKLYVRQEEPPGGGRKVLNRALSILGPQEHRTPPSMNRPTAPIKPPLRRLTEQAILDHIAPAAALVDAQGHILYLHGRSGAFLELAPGEVRATNILAMAREGLKQELTTALHKAAETEAVVRCPNLRIRSNGDFWRVNLLVRMVKAEASASPSAPLFLVLFEEATPPSPLDRHESSSTSFPSPDRDLRLAALRLELQAKEDYLRTSNEELETANEELQSANEEMQSMNEELQSANEELETSKEELQSVNEELSTVNAELQTKMLDLTHACNDMNNLLAGTGIGTLFVDRQLNIRRFTPAAARIIHLIPGDVGRPIGHLVSHLVGYDELLGDIQSVLDTLVPKEVEVRTREGRWYIMRIQLYRTLENVIEGAVITFIDVTELKSVQSILERDQAHLRALESALPQGVMICTSTGLVEHLSPQWAQVSRTPQTEILGHSWLEQVHSEDRVAVTAEWTAALSRGGPFSCRCRLRDLEHEAKRFAVSGYALQSGHGAASQWLLLWAELNPSLL